MAKREFFLHYGYIFQHKGEQKKEKYQFRDIVGFNTTLFKIKNKNLKELKLNEIIDHQCRDLRCNGLLLPWIHVHDLKEFISNNYYILY